MQTENVKRMWLDITKIDQGKSVQLRAATNLETVEQYAQAMADGADFPPVIVFRDSEGYYLADGWHRLKAAESLGKTHIEVSIRSGSERDAVDYAISANATHGRQRTQADKERVILYMLGDPEWSQMSEAEMRRKAKISDPAFVRKVREKYNLERQSVKTFKRGEKLITVNVKNIGADQVTWAQKAAQMPYNAKVLKSATKAIEMLDAKLQRDTTPYFSKKEVFTFRKLLCAAIEECELKVIAAALPKAKGQR
jgi:uncharacterized protein (DUF1015 family)